MDSLIETFHIDLKIIIAQAVNFAVVLVVLYFFALKPLAKIMKERSETIQSGLDDAEKNKKLLADSKIVYDQALSDAKQKAEAIFASIVQESENKRSEMMQQAKMDAEKIVTNGKNVLEAEKVKMVAEAKKEIVSIAIKATEKLLGSNIDSSFNNKVIKELDNL